MIMDSDTDLVRNFQLGLINTPHSPHDAPLPSSQDIQRAEDALLSELPDKGVGIQETLEQLKTVQRGFNNGNQSSLYFGFVTGGINPAAAAAETMVSAYDQNVGVHLPKETLATRLESNALKLLCRLLDFDPQDFEHRTFTTGATASNILGLACGREYVLQARCKDLSVGRDGLFQVMRSADVDEVQVLTTVPHSSLAKAASIVGLGRHSIKCLGEDAGSHIFDLEKVEELLRRPRTASIVVISCGEVNTGFFAPGIKKLRALCDRYDAYIHVDGAFGLLGRCLRRCSAAEMDHQQLGQILQGCDGLELADSITGDAHKLLNVPYDCGIFLGKHLNLATDVFQNAGAAYLSAGPESSSDGSDFIPSPLNIGLENSRRFRALPVYASLIAYGREGLTEMLLRQIDLARDIAHRISKLDFLQLLPSNVHHDGFDRSSIFVIVLFKAKDPGFNQELVQRIKDTRKIYVSGTSWEGSPATRIAVSNWQASTARDAPVVEAVLGEVYEAWKSEH